MKRPTSQLDQLIARTQRRLLIADAVRLSGRYLMGSAALALGLTLFDRFVVPGLAWWMIAIVALSGLPVACAIAWKRRGPGLSAAARLDDGLRLKDRLGTAVALSLDVSTDQDSGMGRLVQEDAERLAAGIDPRSAAQIEWPMSWGAALLAALCCVPLLLFVKPRNVFAGPDPTPEQVAALDARQQAAQAIRERAEQLRQGEVNDKESQEQADSQARQQALDTLDRLAKQFDAPPPTEAPDGSITPGSHGSDAELSSAAHQAIELADRLDQQSQIDREAQKRAIEGLSGIEPPMTSPTTPGSVDEFARSLRQGDLAAAQQWLDDLADRLKSVPPEERKALANSLRQTAEQIRQAADKQDQPATSQSDAAEQRLDDLGLPPEQIKGWTQDPPSVDDIRRTLQDQGQDPIDAHRLAEQAQRDLARRAVDEKAQRQLEETAKRVADLADSVEQPPPPVSERPPDESQVEPKSDGKEQPGATPPDAATPRSTSDKSKGAGDTSDAQKTDGADQSSRKDGQPGSGPDQPQSGDKPGSKPGEQPASNGDKGDPGSATKTPNSADPGAKPGEKATPGEGNRLSETAKPDATTKPDETAKPGKASNPSETARPGQEGQPKESPVKAPGESPVTNTVPKESTESGAQPVPEDGPEPPKSNSPQGEMDQPQGTPETGAGGKPQPGAAPSPGESPDGQTPGTRVTPSTEPGSDSAGGDDDSPGSVSDRVKRLRDTLEQIDRSGKSADQGQAISQEMRDAAKDLLDRMSPQEREELQRWAEAKARENNEGGGSGTDGSPKSLLDRTLPTQALPNPRLFDYDTQDVDLSAKGETPNDRVIAEMYGPDQKQPEGAIDRQPMNATQMREAAQAIERALNEEAIPPRYRSLIRNWARRMPKAEEPARPSAESSDP